ncbi:MAG TPA: NAD(P)-dependent oxidoreductase [Gemmatimonadales bacterium]|nr:NAD(P)-dependent oxidoreductase [Gemmatimonadales bacterium]
MSATAPARGAVAGGWDAAYRGVRVVVLGAAGFIGRWVARELAIRNARVYAVVRDRQAAVRILATCGTAAELVELDVTDADSLLAFMRAVRPAVSFNLIGYGVDPSERDVHAAYRVNARLVGTLCAAAAAARDPGWRGQHVVHVGSALEYGKAAGSVAECARPHPDTLYGRSKLAGTCILTRECQRLGLRGLTARLFTVYGPGEHPSRLLPSLMEAARSGQPLRLTSGEQRRDFTFIQDAAIALLRLGVVSSVSGEIVNVATGKLISVREFAETAAHCLGLPRHLLQFGALPTRPEEMYHPEVPVERCRRLLGWVPSTTIRDGIRQTLACMRQLP